MYQKDFDNTGNIREFAVWAADFIDNLPVGMYRTTLEGEFVFCNWTFANILGYDAPAMLQDFRVVEFFPHKPERGKFIKEVLEQGNVKRYPMQLKKKDGELLYCSTTAKAKLNDDGLVTYIDGVMIESNENENENQELNENYILEDSDSQLVYLRLSQNGIIKDLDKSSYDFLGVNNTFNTGALSFYSFLDPSSSSKLTYMLYSAYEQEHIHDILTINTSHGKKQIECQAYVNSNLEDEYNILLACRDISSAIDRLKQNDREEKLQGVLEMAGGVAHNMNQPLTVMNNLLQDLFSYSYQDDTVQDKLNRLQNQIIKLNTLAQKIRSVKQYKSMHYLLGEKIIDLDNIS